MSTYERSQHDRALYETADPVIELRDAEVVFEMDRGVSRVLDNVTLDIQRNEVLGIVGESGSGKSMLASAMLDAVVDPGVLSGQVTYHPADGHPVDVLELSERELLKHRWEDISMVFQGAMSSFNPTMEVGAHFEETIEAHDYDIGAGMDRARELLEDLYLDPDRVLPSYPHELSGGMKQRALIALSLVLEPDVLVMDEPTAALDLLMQRSILSLLESLKEKYDLTLIFITHDLPLVAELADRLAVMYAFELVEIGATEEILRRGSHPYTRSLLNATPNLDAPLEEMRPIEGAAPDPVDVPSGCSYNPRCPLADDECVASDPAFQAVSDEHSVACYHWQDAPDAIPFNVEVEAAEDCPQTDKEGERLPDERTADSSEPEPQQAENRAETDGGDQ
ncbi:ABC transporter ATP-binding protein [Halostagnicola bangensis]